MDDSIEYFGRVAQKPAKVQPWSDYVRGIARPTAKPKKSQKTEPTELTYERFEDADDSRAQKN